MKKTRVAVRVRLAFLFLAAIVIAVVLGVASNTPKSDAQISGYGAVQDVPSQTIQPISHGSSNTGLVVGVGAGVAILGGAVFVGWRHNHAVDHPYD